MIAHDDWVSETMLTGYIYEPMIVVTWPVWCYDCGQALTATADPENRELEWECPVCAADTTIHDDGE